MGLSYFSVPTQQQEPQPAPERTPNSSFTSEPPLEVAPKEESSETTVFQLKLPPSDDGKSSSRPPTWNLVSAALNAQEESKQASGMVQMISPAAEDVLHQPSHVELELRDSQLDPPEPAPAPAAAVRAAEETKPKASAEASLSPSIAANMLEALLCIQQDMRKMSDRLDRMESTMKTLAERIIDKK